MNLRRYEIYSLFKGSLLSYVVGLYLIVWYLQLSGRVAIFEAIRFEFLLGAILGVVSILVLVTNQQERTSSHRPIIAAALLLLGVLSFYTLFSYDRGASFHTFINSVLKLSLIALFIIAATRKIEDLRVIVFMLFLAWLKLGSEGFIGWHTGSMVWFNQGIPRLHGTTGILLHPNSFSGFAVGCLPFCIFMFFGGVKSWIFRLLFLVLFVFCVIIIINTGSRTGYVAVGLGALFFLYKMKKHRLKALTLIFLVSTVTVHSVSEYHKERFISIFTLEEAVGDSSGTRLQIMRDAIDIYKMHPFGVGVDAFPAMRMHYFDRYQDTHNLYLQILTNTGPVGAISFFLFIYLLVKCNFKNIRLISNYLGHAEDPEKQNLKFCLALNYALIGFVVLRLFLGFFGMDLYEVYWWLALGLSLACAKVTAIELGKIQYKNGVTYN